MELFKRIKKFFKKNLRYIVGGLVLLFGAVFMFIPFIPLGYILLAAGAFLLAPTVPFLRKVLKYIEKKDKKNRVKKLEDKIRKFFRRHSE